MKKIKCSEYNTRCLRFNNFGVFNICCRQGSNLSLSHGAACRQSNKLNFHLARDGGIMVEQLTHQPKLEGLTAAAPNRVEK
jgi:hypothetical protein